MYVRFSNKYIQRATGKKGFFFDANGRYETDNEVLCKVLKQHFLVEEKTEDTKEEVKIYHCKHCNFETENKGKLAAHSKTHKEV